MNLEKIFIAVKDGKQILVYEKNNKFYDLETKELIEEIYVKRSEIDEKNI